MSAHRKLEGRGYPLLIQHMEPDYSLVSLEHLETVPSISFLVASLTGVKQVGEN